MADNAVLKYLDLICRNKYSTKHSFFANKKSFDPPVADTSIVPLLVVQRTPPRRRNGHYANTPQVSPIANMQDLPIHQILKDIHWALEAKNHQYFEPMMLHYWQLLRLLEILRCDTKILSLISKQGANSAKIEQLRKEMKKIHPDLSHAIRAKESEIEALEIFNAGFQNQIAIETIELRNGNRPQEKENIQAVLVLSTLLKVILREGMSVAVLSDRFRLDAQQQESKALLEDYCGITFDETEPAFAKLFKIHDEVQTIKTIPERIVSEVKDNWNWFWGNWPTGAPGLLATARASVSRVLGTEAAHIFYNHFRLGGNRGRRLFRFLEPFLQNETYSAFFKKVDPYLGFILSYFNCLFFIPRLSLHLSLLGHHLFNDAKLQPLERKMPLLTRFRVHWMRFGFEFIIDTYWILSSLKLFWLPGGAFSPQGIIISLIIQFLDLLCSTVRAVLELLRLSQMASDLNALEPNLVLAENINKRYWFEATALGYMVFHFSVLMLSLCLTLPSVAAVSTLLPVIGGVCAVLLTVVTYFMQEYFARRRETLFECRPPSLAVEENPSHPPSLVGVTPRLSRYF